MDCAARTALEVLQCKGSDAVPGILAVVHTFGRDLKFNPHVHMLVTEGGLTSGQEWKEIPFLPYNLLRRKWQYYLLTDYSTKFGFRERITQAVELPAEVNRQLWP